MSRPRNHRIAIGYLGALLVAQGLGKLLDIGGYRLALERFDVLSGGSLGIAVALWIAAELAAGAGLLWVAATQPPAGWVPRLAGIGALAISVAYGLLTASATLRGLAIDNCTCFGVHLPQKLGPFVLFQDALMLLWSGWAAKSLSTKSSRS